MRERERETLCWWFASEITTDVDEARQLEELGELGELGEWKWVELIETYIYASVQT